MELMFLGFTSPFNAAVVDALTNAGASLIGKTNMDEFGMGQVIQSAISADDAY